MDIPQKIKAAERIAGISEAQLSDIIGTSRSAFNQRMKTGKFSTSELEKIATALGAKFEFKFVFEDGTEI